MGMFASLIHYEKGVNFELPNVQCYEFICLGFNTKCAKQYAGHVPV